MNRAITAALMLSLSAMTARGDDAALLGAKAVLAKAAEAQAARSGAAAPAPAQTEQDRIKADTAALATRIAAMPPAEAAAAWLALVDRVAASPRPTGSFSWEDYGLAPLFAALPGPPAWDALSAAIEARPAGEGAAGVRELGLKLIAAALKSDQARSLALLADLDKATVGLDSNRVMNMRWVLRTLAEASIAQTDDPERAVDEFVRSLDRLGANAAERFGSQPLAAPDLVALVGEPRAEALLRRALLESAGPLRIDSGDRTRRLARKVAVESIKEIKSPQWSLAQDIEATALYEGLVARFVKPAVKPGTDAKAEENAADRLKRLAEEQQTASNPWEQRAASLYYVMGLVVQGRAAEASEAAVALNSKDPNTVGEMNVEKVIAALVKSGRAAPAYEFLRELLAEQPQTQVWETFIRLSAQLHKSAETLALLQSASESPLLDERQRNLLRGRLASALLAADRVEDGIAALRAEIAARAPGKPVSEVYSPYGNAATRLATLGLLLKRPELVDEGVAASVATLADMRAYERQTHFRRVFDLLRATGRDAQLESLLCDELAQCTTQNESESWNTPRLSAPAILEMLTRLYDALDRSADVVALLDLAQGWGEKDLADIPAPEEYQWSVHSEGDHNPLTPILLAAARAFAHTGKREEALRCVQEVLYKHPGLDPAFELLLELQGTDAIAFLDRLYARDQFEERPLIWKAELLRRAKRLDEATACVNRAIAIDPSDGEQGRGRRMRAYAVLAEIDAARGDEKQRQFLQGVVKAIRTAESADQLYEVGLLSPAIQRYNESLSFFSDAYCIQSRLAVQLAEAGRTDEAAEHFRRAYALMPDSFGRMESHCFGCEGAFSGDFAQGIAEQVLGQLLIEKPDKPQLHYLMGYLRKEQDRPQDALPYFRRAAELDPDYINAWQRILELRGSTLVPAALRADAALNKLRLDPLARHGNVDLAPVTDLRALWALFESRSRLAAPEPGSLYPLTASKATREKLDAAIKESGQRGEFPRNRRGRMSSDDSDQELASPGTLLGRTPMLRAVNSLYVATLGSSWN